MGRVRIVDTLELAKNTRRTFTKKEPKELREYPWTWPTQLQHVGDSLAVAYASDKWKDDGDYELYKHLAESRNRALCVPGFLAPLGSQDKYPVYGPMVDFTGVTMGKHIALLGYFEEADLQLHVGEHDGHAYLGDKNEGVVRVMVKHALLGGGVMDGDRPFLVVYSEPRDNDPGGVHMIITGDELDIEADGIVG